MQSKPISVCLAIYGVSLKGGSEKSVIWLANQLKQHGHRPFILVHESGDVSQTAFPLAPGVPVISTQSFQDKGTSLFAKLQLIFMKWCGKTLFPNSHYFWWQRYKELIEGYRQGILEHRPDIVLAYLPVTFTYVSEAMVGLNIPLVVANRNDPARDFSLARNKSSRYDLQARFKSIERDFSINCVQLEPFKAFFSAAVQDKTVVIPNHIKPFVYSEAACLEARAQSPRKILTVASLTRKKNQQMLLQAFALQATDYPEWQLVMVGGGKLEASLRALAQSLGIAERVRFEGVQEMVEEYYKSASIFALPSAYEGLSNALLEAMSAGLPSVVLETCTGNRFLVQEAQGGIACQTNTEALSQSLGKLMASETLRIEWGANARAYVAAYTEQRTYELWQSTILRAVEAGLEVSS